MPASTPLNHRRAVPVGDSSTPGIVTFALGRLSDASLQHLMFTKAWAVKGLAVVGLRVSNLLVAPVSQVSAPSQRCLRECDLTSAGRLGSLHKRLHLHNTVVNTMKTLVAVNALTSSLYPFLGSFADCIGWKQWAGLALFAVEISMETISEESRKRFKKDPKNKGKIYDTGLSFVRHRNYLGYTLWRTGTTLAAASLVAIASALTVMQIMCFATTGIPDITSYMSRKQG
ncbi:hypothetical protein DFH09DRAFT_1310823 [Mycena vulgaris]|nr:hypothetical protein DFH09DRAFT_1310823 [Mycena vulgaris]